MKYVLNYLTILLNYIPHFLRGEKAIYYVFSALKPLRVLNQQFGVYVDDTLYYLAFNGQVMNLEKYLNDLYDPTLIRIYIDNLVYDVNYLWNKDEAEVFYMYNLWRSTDSYVLNDYMVHLGIVYRALQPSTGIAPLGSPTYWEDTGENSYWYNDGEAQNDTDYIIYIPNSILTALTTDEYNTLIARINQYNLASKRYLIIGF